jgi:hydroxyacylglutathione hydrolase
MPEILPIPAFNDNYIWLICDRTTGLAWVVDPGDAAPVIDALARMQLQLEGVLITHHHFDHVGGLSELQSAFRPRVIGPDNPAIAGLDRTCVAGDRVTVLGLELQVMEVPGHTLDHIAYYCESPEPVLFCGDTLFAGGCGRLFEGTPPMMLESLQSLASLPDETRVYCAHEYTLSNLDFALAVEPDNLPLQQRMASARAMRDAGEPTVPSTLALERATNPFLRCEEKTLVTSLEQQGKLENASPAGVFSTVRAWKDNY